MKPTSVIYKNIKMRNRKIGSMPAKTQQKTRGRQKKEKPLLKIPTVLKIKISPAGTTSKPNVESRSTDNQQANQTKFTGNDIKIMLANEVIRAQFPKKCKEPIKKIKDDIPNTKTIDKKPILNRKLRSSITVSEEINKECINSESKKRGAQKILRKRSIKLTDNLPPEEPVENIVVSPKPVKKETSKPVKLRRRKDVNDVETSVEVDVVPEKKDSPKKTNIVAKRKLSAVKSTPGPKTRSRKVNVIKDVKEETLTKDVPEEKKEVIPIIIQKDLLSSSTSELSWTKDISSSSTTTCVTVSSNDFFRIDKKLPLVKLSNVDCKRKLSDKMCNNNSVRENSSKLQNGVYPTLNLSTSSSCDTSSQGVQSPKNVLVLSKLGETLNKLAYKLKNFDLEVINWIGCTNEKTNNNIDILNDKMVQGGFMREERDIIYTCKEINTILSNNPNVENETEIPVINEADSNIKVSNKLVSNIDLQNEENKNIISTEADLNVMGKEYVPLEDNDDDDALSLFAESITGIDSSRRNSSFAATDLPEVEEYVPEPVFRETFKSPEIAYKPSRISLNTKTRSDGNNVMSSNCCEKQNADSTSIYKENENTVCNNFYEDKIGDFSKNVTYNGIQQNSSPPRLMASIHKPKHGIHSYIFRGVCFFYLISSCKKTICNFPHTSIEIEEVKKKLTLISEHLFIEEYMMIRTWPLLRRKYGRCFVEECIRRELSRFLIEMAIDFVIKAKENSRDDNILKIDVIETTLLYLNKVDLNTCADLLKYKVQNLKRVLLCELFIHTIADSQNFSQFKSVFINLTEFMFNIQRTFDINVATLILERVSILPYDEGLARALIKIIKNTDLSILSNPMIVKLEKQLMSSNLNLFNELMGLQGKKYTNHSVCYNKMPNESTTSVTINNNVLTNNDIRYSPDTTNLDYVNKTLEPVITRTIDLKKIQPHLKNKMTKLSTEGSKNKYNNWSNRTVFDNIRYKCFNQLMMPNWPGCKRRSNPNLETRPSKYQRRDGPSYSQDFL